MTLLQTNMFNLGRFRIIQLVFCIQKGRELAHLYAKTVLESGAEYILYFCRLLLRNDEEYACLCSARAVCIMNSCLIVRMFDSSYSCVVGNRKCITLNMARWALSQYEESCFTTTSPTSSTNVSI